MIIPKLGSSIGHVLKWISEGCYHGEREVEDEEREVARSKSEERGWCG